MGGQNGLETKKRKFLPFIYVSNPRFLRDRFDRVKNVIFTAPYYITDVLEFLVFSSHLHTSKGPRKQFPRECFDRVKNVIFTAPYPTPPQQHLVELSFLFICISISDALFLKQMPKKQTGYVLLLKQNKSDLVILIQNQNKSN